MESASSPPVWTRPRGCRMPNRASRYAAAGFNVNIPIFNGRLFNARHVEATSQANAQQQYLRDLQDRIVRDVRTAWLNAGSAFQRLAVTDQLLSEATQADRKSVV